MRRSSGGGIPKSFGFHTARFQNWTITSNCIWSKWGLSDGASVEMWSAAAFLICVRASRQAPLRLRLHLNLFGLLLGYKRLRFTLPINRCQWNAKRFKDTSKAIKVDNHVTVVIFSLLSVSDSSSHPLKPILHFTPTHPEGTKINPDPLLDLQRHPQRNTPALIRMSEEEFLGIFTQGNTPTAQASSRSD